MPPFVSFFKRAGDPYLLAPNKKHFLLSANYFIAVKKVHAKFVTFILIRTFPFYSTGSLTIFAAY